MTSPLSSGCKRRFLNKEAGSEGVGGGAVVVASGGALAKSLFGGHHLAWALPRVGKKNGNVG